MSNASKSNIKHDRVVVTSSLGYRKREDIAASRHDSYCILVPACESECWTIASALWTARCFGFLILTTTRVVTRRPVTAITKTLIIG